MDRPARTREHWRADLSINHVERFIFHQGHSAQRIQNDYGYDLVMQTFDYGDDAARTRGAYEGGIIYFQFKATDRLTILKDGDTIAYPVECRHLELWQQEPMPVYLIVYDAVAEQAYWLYMKPYLRTARLTWLPTQKEVTVRLSLRSVVDGVAVETFRQHKAEVLQRIQAGEFYYG